MTVNSDDPVGAANRLQQSMAQLGAEIRGLRSYGKHNRKFILILALSLLFDLALTVGLIAVTVDLSKVNSLTEANRQAAMTTCKSGNEARKAQIDLWNYVLDLTIQDPRNQGPDTMKKTEDFRLYLAKILAPRDCSR